MRVVLTSPDSGGSGRTFILHQLPVLVGRNPSAQVCLEDRRVSRRHCRIDQLDGALLIRDLGSKNGTFINGMRIKQSLLKPGEKLTVGRMDFIVDYAPGDLAPAPHDGAAPGDYDVYWEGAEAADNTSVSEAEERSWWDDGPYEAPTEPDDE